MKVDQIRESFLEFFEKKGHTVVASDSLVPQNDPTLLFTGAGMNQFKENFLGLKKDLKRAASSQKCLRTGDLDEVGRTAYHHSFFEMLGNFSFGDYFKKDAIRWAWEYFTVTLKIPAERLRVSIHQDDDEAFKIWKDEDKIKIRPDWIYKLGDKDNFWPSNAPKNGPNGPCGPCSEIYFDMDPAKGSGGSVEDSGRFTEIWNLVFTQFDRQEGGKLVPLAQKNIDTGMGLERLGCVLQGKKSNYEIDIFQFINGRIEELLLGKGRVEDKNRAHLYAISDHVRAVTFSIADGVMPSNEGRGYVIRKLIRRALWRAHQIKPMQEQKPFLYAVVPIIAATMVEPYPEIREASASISATIFDEEFRFLNTFQTGSKLLAGKLANLKSRTLPGEIVFELYDTYGFPDELTKMIVREKGLEIDQTGFDKLMTEQRKRAKEASQISNSIFVATDLDRKVSGLPPTKFLGYETLSASGKVLVAEFEGKKGFVVLDQTPCYAESGGQVGDQGIMEGAGFKARIADTQKKDVYVVHYVEAEKSALKTGDQVKVIVDQGRRERAMRNHTATHLLHAALRDILGKQVRQLGSLVSPEKLRFDYSYGEPLTREQITKIEDSVNEQILKDISVSKEEKSMEEAKTEGAIAFFGEKYGKKVRVVTVPGYSKELCGGTHCDRTGQIGSFIIVSDSSIASGTRRIEALTGEGALQYTRMLRSQVQEMAETLRAPVSELPQRVSKLQDSVKKLEKEKDRNVISKIDPKQTLRGSRQVGSILFETHYAADLGINGLSAFSDDIRSKRSVNTIFLTATGDQTNNQYILAETPDLKQKGVDVRPLWKLLESHLEATGGGNRPDLVRGGGPNRGQFDNCEELIQTATAYIGKMAK